MVYSSSDLDDSIQVKAETTESPQDTDRKVRMVLSSIYSSSSSYEPILVK